MLPFPKHIQGSWKEQLRQRFSNMRRPSKEELGDKKQDTDQRVSSLIIKHVLVHALLQWHNIMLINSLTWFILSHLDLLPSYHYPVLSSLSLSLSLSLFSLSLPRNQRERKGVLTVKMPV